MKLKGRAWKFGDDISTDLIAPGRLFHLRTNLPELAKHILEDADPNFAKKVKPGDLIVAGKNFGLGSSREHAAAIIKLAGVGGVLARSFARIFYRNAINVGLPALICDASQIDQGDELEVDIEKGKIRNLTKEIVIETKPLPKVMLNILEDGGLIEHFKKHGKFKL
ncbi:MAG: 3-isopropylmalate dehydratase small subunit [Actinomycetota bacterium]|nr:3-isopropylmalate dehydratase small subunit [Actinomycetota bacterium]